MTISDNSGTTSQATSLTTSSDMRFTTLSTMIFRVSSEISMPGEPMAGMDPTLVPSVRPGALLAAKPRE